MLIGQLAKETGVPVRTIRYYDEIGLLPASSRTRSGYRRYGKGHVRTLAFVRMAQQLGMSLGQIRTILETAINEDSACSCVRSTIKENIKHLDDHISRLTTKRDQLLAAQERLDSGANTRSDDASICPVIESIEITLQPHLDSPVDWRE